MEFRKIDNKIIFVYYVSEYIGRDWVRENLKEKKEVTFKRTLTFKAHEEYEIQVEGDSDYEIFLEDFPPIGFEFAELKGDYYKVRKEIIGTKNDFYFHKEIIIG